MTQSKFRHVFFRDPDLLTLTDFCRYTGMSRAKAYKEIITGRLFASKIGNLIVIHQQDVDRWLETTHPTASAFDPFSTRSFDDSGSQIQPPF